MSFDSSTEAQKVEAVRQLTNAGKDLYVRVSGGQMLDSSVLDTAMASAATALRAMGASALASTEAIVADGQTIAVTGGTVTLHVTNGALTATYTAS